MFPKCSVDADKESVLIESGFGSFTLSRADRIESNKNFVVGHSGPFRSNGQRIGTPQHEPEPQSRTVCMFDPTFLKAEAAKKPEGFEFARIVDLLVDSVLFEEG